MKIELEIVVLLRAAWVAGILPIIIAYIPCKTFNFFHHLLLSFVKRGKIMQSSSTKLSVPQKFFCHFYVLGVLWTMVLLSATWVYAYTIEPLSPMQLSLSNIASDLTGASRTVLSKRNHLLRLQHRYGIWSSVFMLLLMEAHVLRRLYESIYVFNYSPSARMHLLGYITGLFFYTAAPLSLCCKYAPEVFNFAVGLVQEFIVKGKHRMQISEIDFWAFVHPLMQLRWYAWVGAVIFIWGWVHQRRCHEILGSLRERNKLVEYAIPYGDWFEYVSSPHYLAEIVIYLGLLVTSGFTDFTIWLLLGFVVANLLLAAAETQRWYMCKFDNYPRDRRTIFPFVY